MNAMCEYIFSAGTPAEASELVQRSINSLTMSARATSISAGGFEALYPLLVSAQYPRYLLVSKSRPIWVSHPAITPAKRSSLPACFNNSIPRATSSPTNVARPLTACTTAGLLKHSCGIILIGVADQSSRLQVFGVLFQSSHSTFSGLLSAERRAQNIESSMWKPTATS